MNLSSKGAMYGAVGGLLGGAAVGYLAGEGTKAVGKRTAVGAVAVGLLGAAGGALLGPSSGATPPPGGWGHVNPNTGQMNPPDPNISGGDQVIGQQGQQTSGQTSDNTGTGRVPRRVGGGIPQLSPAARR